MMNQIRFMDSLWHEIKRNMKHLHSLPKKYDKPHKKTNCIHCKHGTTDKPWNKAKTWLNERRNHNKCGRYKKSSRREDLDTLSTQEVRFYIGKIIL